MMNTLNAFENLNKNDTVIIIETSDSMSRGEYRCHFYLSNDSIEKYRFYAFRCDHQPVFDKKKGRGFPIYSIATNCRLEYIPPRGDTSLHPIIEAVQNDNIEEHIAVESERGTLPCIYYMVSVLIKNPKGEYDYRGYYYHTK
ncbi:hypothetical protein [Dysgonomonas sp. PH5-37]|uniref:hypothetical protein n=2 Tax=unclassified Dysgonomonas TaxID=2630389 RepID=UPI002477109A|nr:hypothetical protein [Dysgonomonas sp. PH5-37]